MNKKAEPFTFRLMLTEQEHYQDYPRLAAIPADLVHRARETAKAFHGQTLERLEERGGLCPLEFACLILGICANRLVLDEREVVGPICKAFRYRPESH